MESKSGIFKGINHGFIVTKPKKETKKEKPSRRAGKLGKRVSFVREVIREVAGFAPFERKMIELIRTGDAGKEKKALKIARRRLGAHNRACRKRDEMNNVIQAQKRKQ